MISRLLQQTRNLKYELQARGSRLLPKVQYEIPYVCQFATPESAEASLRNGLLPTQDPHWKETGASSPERYAEWAFTMCGMASVAMALGYFKERNFKPAELAEDALQADVYVEEANGLSSMRYKEFAAWIRKYGLHAHIYSRLSIRGVQYALSQNKLVIISVNPNIRGYDTAPRSQKGGHLVLVTGYDLKEGTISINNPSGFMSMDSQVNHALPVPGFKRYYAGRGIVVSNDR